MPGDKSISHRALLFSILGNGACRIENLSSSADVRSSLEAGVALGARAEITDTGVLVEGLDGNVAQRADIDCGNSGTTMRLLMGILAGCAGEFSLDGDASLRRRPMERIAGPLRDMGAEIETAAGTCPIRIHGRELHGAEFTLPVASAQLKSAMMLAGLRASGETIIHEPILSRDHTERMLAAWGADISRDRDAWHVRKSGFWLPDRFMVPGDVSSAAFLLCAAAIMPGSLVTAENVLLNPTRTGFIGVLKRMGARLSTETVTDIPEPAGNLTAEYSPYLSATTVTEDEVPALVDEVPILALTATQAEGATVFEGVGELRVKESDRLGATASQLNLMGADVIAEADRLIVRGPTPLRPPPDLDSFDDHRIAMTLRIASLLTNGSPAIRNERCTAISFPSFHDTLNGLMK